MSWAVWDDQHVVYHHPSGKTHLLNPGSALLIRSVLVKPLSPADAAVELARLQGAMADERFIEHLRQLLVRFDEWGLVERVS